MIWRYGGWRRSKKKEDAEWVQFELPFALQNRLQLLLDQQQMGKELSEAEQNEAKGLVELSEFLTLLKLKHKRSQA